MVSAALHLLLLGLACTLPSGVWAGEAAAQCQGDAQDSDSDSPSLMQGGLKPVRAVQQGSKNEEEGGKATCFRAALSIDPKAVPVNSESIASVGYGIIKVWPKAVFAKVEWSIPGVKLKNPVIGMHVHKGDCETNGPILVGFCGQDPLPAFSGPCSQGTDVKGYEVMGMACDITGSGSPCANNGTATIEQAAEALTASKDPKESFYLNVHTQFSFDESNMTALGLIRGQLEALPHCWR